jgi:predicted component of type VI protein secretion system
MLRESLRLAWDLDYTVVIQCSIYSLACVAASREQPVLAARLWGAVEGLEEAYGVRIASLILSVTNYEGRLGIVRAQLGEEAYSEAWAEGKAMALERAVEYSLSEDEQHEPPVPSLRRSGSRHRSANERKGSPPASKRSLSSSRGDLPTARSPPNCSSPSARWITTSPTY